MIVQQEDEAVRYESLESGVTLTLNRPGKGNALSPEMVDALDIAFDRAVQSGARMVVFRGAGKHLCTGFDLTDIDSCSDGDLLLRFVRIEQLLQKVHRCPMVTVAVGSGRVYGAGADLFTACDRRVATPETRFAFPGSNFGLVLGTRRLSTRVGQERARRILIDGSVLSSVDAAKIGLVTDPLEEPELDSRLREFQAKSVRLSCRTIASLNAATLLLDDDADMAALVNSASLRGLKDRICQYRQAVLRQRN